MTLVAKALILLILGGGILLLRKIYEETNPSMTAADPDEHETMVYA